MGFIIVNSALVLSFFPIAALCGGVSAGGSCSATDNHLDPSTHRLLTDCDDRTFCSSSTNGTCQPKQCRRDDFPFGYGLTDTLPPLCGDGTFCPDEGSGCQSLIPVGQPCQMNRDEQCAPPKNAEELASSQNFNGAVCLQSTCTYANATIGQRCVIDDTTYVDTGSDGQQFGNRIIRHNCQTPLLYCDLTSSQCFLAKPVGMQCELDYECRSYNCGSQGNCIASAGATRPVQHWQYTVAIVVVVISMAMTGTMLVVIHQRLRLQQHRDLREYYYEQISLRQSMFALHRRAASRQQIGSSLYSTSGDDAKRY